MKKKRLSAPVDSRLDIFFTNLEAERKKKLVDYVENITFKALKDRVTPKLRLKSKKE